MPADQFVNFQLVKKLVKRRRRMNIFVAAGPLIPAIAPSPRSRQPGKPADSDSGMDDITHDRGVAVHASPQFTIGIFTLRFAPATPIGNVMGNTANHPGTVRPPRTAVGGKEVVGPQVGTAGSGGAFRRTIGFRHLLERIAHLLVFGVGFDGHARIQSRTTGNQSVPQ